MAAIFAMSNIILLVILIFTCVDCIPSMRIPPYCESLSVGDDLGVLVNKVVHSEIADDVVDIKKTGECSGTVNGVEVFGCYREYFDLSISPDFLFLNINRNFSDSDPVDIYLQLNTYCLPESTSDDKNGTTYDYESTTDNVNQTEADNSRLVMLEARTGVERAQEDVERAVKKLLKAEKSEKKVQKRIQQANLAIQSAEKSVVVAQKGVLEAQKAVAKVNEKNS